MPCFCKVDLEDMPVLSIFKSELNFDLNMLPEFEVLMQFNGSLNVNLNFKYCLMPKLE